MQGKIKVVFLIAHLGGGGAERVTTILANEFAKNPKYDIEMIVFDSKFKEYEISKSVNVIFMPEYTNKFISVCVKMIKLRDLLGKANPDYVCSLGFSYKYLYFTHVMHKYKFVLSERNAPQYQHNSKFLLHMVKYCFKKSYRVVFQTEDARDFYKTEIREKGIVIPNPINSKLPEIYSGERENKIVAYSRLTAQKNMKMMLKAFSDFLKIYPDYILEIYGRGEEEFELKAYTKQLHLSDKVHFMGFKSNVHECIRNAKMFVSSSDYEGISNSMIESLAIGLPCVCTDCPAGGSKMFIKNDVNGYLVPVNDSKAMTEAMCKVINNEMIYTTCHDTANELRSMLQTEKVCKQWMDIMQ